MNRSQSKSIRKLLGHANFRLEEQLSHLLRGPPLAITNPSLNRFFDLRITTIMISSLHSISITVLSFEMIYGH